MKKISNDPLSCDLCLFGDLCPDRQLNEHGTCASYVSNRGEAPDSDAEILII